MKSVNGVGWYDSSLEANKKLSPMVTELFLRGR